MDGAGWRVSLEHGKGKPKEQDSVFSTSSRGASNGTNTYVT